MDGKLHVELGGENSKGIYLHVWPHHNCGAYLMDICYDSLLVEASCTCTRQLVLGISMEVQGN